MYFEFQVGCFLKQVLDFKNSQTIKCKPTFELCVCLTECVYTCCSLVQSFKEMLEPVSTQVILGASMPASVWGGLIPNSWCDLSLHAVTSSTFLFLSFFLFVFFFFSSLSWFQAKHLTRSILLYRYESFWLSFFLLAILLKGKVKICHRLFFYIYQQHEHD